MDSSFRRRTKIVWTLLGAFVLVGVVPVIISHYFLTGINERSLETLESKYLTRSAVGIASEIEGLIASTMEQLRSNALAITVGAERLGSSEDPFIYMAETGRISDFISENSNYLTLWMVNREGRGATAQPANTPSYVVDAMNEALDQALRGEEYVGNFLYLDFLNRPAVITAVPVTSGEDVEGAIVSLIDLSSIAERLETERRSGEATAYVVNDRGDVLMHSDAATAVQRPNMSDVGVVREFMNQPVRLTKTYERDFAGEPVEVLGTVAPVSNTGWGVVVERDVSQAFVSVSEMNKATLQWVALAVILAAIVGTLFATRISSPIRDLASKSREIAAGNYNQRVNVKGANEIAELGANFNVMSAEIEKAFDDLRKAAHENHVLFINSIRMLAAAIDAKDPYTRGHSERVAKYSLAIGKKMNLDKKSLSDLRVGALLHDVGKIGIEDRILRKPGALTEEEFEVMKTHPKKGEVIMSGVPQLINMIPGMKYHHERWEGGGYPDGLKGEEIPMQARIVMVADTFDAMTTNRPYQKAMKLDYVLSKIRSFGGTRFDPKVVEAFLAAMDAGEIIAEKPEVGAA